MSTQDDVPPLAGFIHSSFSPLAAEVAQRCLSTVRPDPSTAVIIVSPAGDVETAAAAAAPGRISPLLFFQAVPNAVAYRITPVLIKPGPIYSETEILPYATIQTRDAAPRVELRRQLLPRSTYAFELRSVDAEGRVSPASRSQDIQL